jgi:uncharacterized membrane protein YoaK (UPF0700 family)
MPCDRPSQFGILAALSLGTASLIVGLIAGIFALAFGGMAAAYLVRPYHGSGEDRLVDACFPIIALLTVSHGLTPEPSWNRPVFMLSALAGCWRIYLLPVSALVLGVLAASLGRRSGSRSGRVTVAATAVRFSVAGASLGGFAVACFLGWLLIRWFIWA